MKKRLFAAVLAALMALTFMSVEAHAEQTLKKGDVIEYFFSVGECPNVAGIAVDSFYNSALLEMKGDPEFLIAGQGIFNPIRPGKIKWNTMINGGREFKGEDVFVERFTVKEDCTLSDAALSFEVVEVFNHGLETLPNELVSAHIKLNGAEVVTETPKPDEPDPVKPEPADDEGLYGDLDGDGKITAADALTVLRASIGIETLTEKQAKAANVDGDGSITANDALAVLRNSIGLSDSSKVGTKVGA